MELFVSIDPAFSSDSAGYCSGSFNRSLNGVNLVEVGEMRPPLTPDVIFELVETLTTRVQDKTKAYGYPVRTILDISSNMVLALELARRVPVANLALVKFHGADGHSPHPTPTILGLVAGKNTAAPVWGLSRRELIFALEIAAARGRVVLPLDDLGQKEGLDILRKQLSELSLRVTDAGRTIVESGAHDDVAMAVAQALFVCERWPQLKNHAKWPLDCLSVLQHGLE
jgi:hypothetical protein